MKHTSIIIWVLAMVTMLSSCFPSNQEVDTSTVPQGNLSTEVIPQVESSPAITFENFTPWMTITSPYIITGTIKRSWFMSDFFSITLTEDNWAPIASAQALWEWLEPEDGNQEISPDDMIQFSATLDFRSPQDAPLEAKIKFISESLNDQGQQDYLEENVILSN